MKVSTILTILFFILALLASIGATSYYYVASIKVAEENAFSHLESVAQSRAFHIETLLEQKEKATIQFSASVVIEEFLLEDKSDSTYNTKLEKINKRLSDTLNLYDSFYEIFILDENGKVVATTNPQEAIGTDFSSYLLFLNAKTEPYTSNLHYEKEHKKIGFVMSAPIKKEESGEFLGVLVIRLDGNILNEITTDKTGLGETGEIYLINSGGYIMTPLLFFDNAILTKKIDTINSRNCLISETEKHVGHEPVEVFLDYRGEKVVGTHFSILKRGWCLLVEIDEVEILGNQRKLFQRVALTIIIYATIIILLIGLLISRFIDERVILRKGIKRL